MLVLSKVPDVGSAFLQFPLDSMKKKFIHRKEKDLSKLHVSRKRMIVRVPFHKTTYAKLNHRPKIYILNINKSIHLISIQQYLFFQDILFFLY